MGHTLTLPITNDWVCTGVVHNMVATKHIGCDSLMNHPTNKMLNTTHA
jgi:hypothetical protein